MKTRKMLVLALMLCLGVLALTGCGTPGPGKVLDSAIKWIEDTDCQAIPSGVNSQTWWLYQRGGRAMTGLAGSLVINGDMFFVRATLVAAAGEEPASPRWIRFSRQDLTDKDVQEKGKDVALALVAAGLVQPLLAMQTMDAAPEVAESSDGNAWVVTGTVTASATLAQLLGKDVASRFVDAEFLEAQRAVTVIVDKKTGRPLQTTIETIPGSSVDAISYTWMRGLWTPADEDTVDLNEYLK